MSDTIIKVETPNQQDIRILQKRRDDRIRAASETTDLALAHAYTLFAREIERLIAALERTEEIISSAK